MLVNAFDKFSLKVSTSIYWYVKSADDAVVDNDALRSVLALAFHGKDLNLLDKLSQEYWSQALHLYKLVNGSEKVIDVRSVEVATIPFGFLKIAIF